MIVALGKTLAFAEETPPRRRDDLHLGSRKNQASDSFNEKQIETFDQGGADAHAVER